VNAAETLERVETWISARDGAGWFRIGPLQGLQRRKLRLQWQDAVARHGADSSPAREARVG
jgi:hypothetical protein